MSRLVATSPAALLNMLDLHRLKDPSTVIHVHETEEPGMPKTPAWFNPRTNEINLLPHLAGINVARLRDQDVNDADRGIFDRMDRNIARLIGLVTHESAHSTLSVKMDQAMKFAREQGEGVDAQTLHVMELLEEIRVEAHAIRRLPRMRPAQRASFTMLLDEIAKKPPEGEAAVARTWALVHGRTLAGVTEARETAPVDTAARTVLGDDKVDELSDLLQEAVQLDLPKQWRRMVEIAQEWIMSTGDDESSTGPEPSCGACVHGAKPGEGDGKGKGTGEKAEEGDPGEGAGVGDDEGDDEGEGGAGGGTPGEGESTPDNDGGEEYGREGGAAAIDNGDDTWDPEDTELMESVARELRKIMDTEWNRIDRSLDIASPGVWGPKVFGNRNQSEAVKWVDPTPEQSQRVTSVANFLSTITVPAISKTPKAMSLPPGRLRSREAVRQSAERSKGMMTVAQPWRGTVRRVSTARPLTIGIATDVSGSMRWAEQVVAEIAFAYANAGHRIGARTAAVTFGDHVNRISRPGEIMTQVGIRDANGGSEVCDYALAALDHVLRLTSPSADAKMLIVVSDGALVRSNETDKVMEWMTRMDKVGTHIIWVAERDQTASFWLTKAAKVLRNLEVVLAFDTALGSHDARRSGTRAITDRVDKAIRKAILDGPANTNR